MQFNQPIYVSELEYELLDVDGVRSISQLCITQDKEYDRAGANIDGGKTLDFTQGGTYFYSYDHNETPADPPVTTSGGNNNYGWRYDFQEAYENGVIRPPSPDNPGVFELKHPNRNIIGVVR